MGGHPKRGLTRALWLAAVPLAAALPASPALADDSASRDAAQVLCLSPAQRSNVIDAAVALGVAANAPTPGHLIVQGRDLTLEAWRQAHRIDFDRTCTALATTQHLQLPPPSGLDGLVSVLKVLLPVSAGAFLTWLTSGWRDAVGRGREHADELHAAAERLVHAVDDLVDQWTDPARTAAPSTRQLLERRADLDAKLRRIGTLHPRWKEPRRLRGILADNRLDMNDASWLRLDERERTARAEFLRKTFRDLADDANSVANALEKPARPHFNMWRRRAADLVENV